MAQRFNFVFYVLILFTFLIQSCGKDDPAAAPAATALTLSDLTISFTCTTSTDCADNSADDGNGASVVFSSGATILAWAYGITVTCSGGSCTGTTTSGTSWINGSLAAVTTVAAGTYAFTIAMDTNGDNTYGGVGEPLYYNASEAVSSATTTITVSSSFGNATGLMAEMKEGQKRAKRYQQSFCLTQMPPGTRLASCRIRCSNKHQS